MHRILVPVDGSPSSEHAIRHVIALKSLILGSVATKVPHLVEIPVTLVK